MTRLKEKERQVDTEQVDAEMDKRSKYVTTAVIYYSSCALGVTMTFLGPAILHFKHKYNSTTQAISLVYTISIVSSLVCGLAFGVIFSHVNRHALITFLMTLMSILIIILPYSPSIILFYIINAVITICCGGFLLSQIVWTLEIWPDNPIFIQGQSFCFSLGNIFPPLIFGPFLSKSPSQPLQNSTFEYQTNFESSNSTLAVHNLPEFIPPFQEDQVNIPCIIIGVIGLVSSTFLLLLLFWLPKRAPPKADMATTIENRITEPLPDGATTESINKENEIVDTNFNSKSQENSCQKTNTTKENKLIKVLLVMCTAIFVASFIAMETSNGQFLPIFGHASSIHLSEAEGAQLLFSFTMAFMGGRLLGILISSFKITPRTFLYFNLSFVLVGNSLIYFWGTHTRILTWIGAILIGLGVSTGAPCVFAHVGGCLKIGNFVGAVVLVTGKSLSTLYALIIGSFIDDLPVILMYTNFASFILGSVTFVGISFVMKSSRGRLKHEPIN